jgi:CRISPR-associated protein Cas1
MKHLLNTLYVTTEGAGLRKDGENLVAEVEGAERARVPLHMLGSVVVFGAIFVSPGLIQACAAAGIGRSCAASCSARSPTSARC